MASIQLVDAWNGGEAMDDRTESDEKVLTFDVPDEALERAASAERQAFTWCIALTAITGTTATGHSSVSALAPAA